MLLPASLPDLIMEAFSENPGLAFSPVAQLPECDVLPHSCHWPLHGGVGITEQRSVSRLHSKPTRAGAMSVPDHLGIFQEQVQYLVCRRQWTYFWSD